MLSVQVQYHSLQENKRHNLQTEEQARNDLNEAIRHNRENEGIAWANYNEAVRHNQEIEAQGWQNVIETIRHDTTTESLTHMYNSIVDYNNMKTYEVNKYKASTDRGSVVYDYDVRSQQNETGRRNAETSRINTWINAFDSILGNFNKNLHLGPDLLKSIN